MTATATRRWTCDQCQQPIADGAGIFWISITTADAFEAHMEGLRGRGETTVADPLSGPSPAAWRWMHVRCCREDPQSTALDDRSYQIAVEELRTPQQLLWWAGHLIEKTWVRSTNLADLLQEWGSR